MQLYQTSPETTLRCFEQSVRDIRAVKIYYWYRGRNAWWQVWATHYSEGCIHTSIESAQSYVEYERTQGSVFYIKQLPAVLLITEGLAVVITQINSDHPLGDYSHTLIEKKAKESWRNDFGTKSIALKRGETFSSIMKSFHPYSSFWVKTPPIKSSVLEVYSSRRAVSFEDLSDEDLMQWKSFPLGQGYRLGWSVPRSAQINTSAVRNLTLLANGV